MEQLQYTFSGGQQTLAFAPVLVGVVGSGNLEVLLEPHPDTTQCSIRIATSARGFGPVWEAVVHDFHRRHQRTGIAISVNDMGATPAVVSLRLDQAMAALSSVSKDTP
jgi:malonate decarboxylase delta subunit